MREGMLSYRSVATPCGIRTRGLPRTSEGALPKYLSSHCLKIKMAGQCVRRRNSRPGRKPTGVERHQAIKQPPAISEAGRDQYRQLLMDEVTPNLTAPDFETKNVRGFAAPVLRRKPTGAEPASFQIAEPGSAVISCRRCAVLFRRIASRARACDPVPRSEHPVRDASLSLCGCVAKYPRSHCRKVFFEEKKQPWFLVRYQRSNPGLTASKK